MMVTLGLLMAAAVATPSPLPLKIGGAASRVEWSQLVTSVQDDWINDLSLLRNGHVVGVGFVNRLDSKPMADWQAVQVEIDLSGKKIAEHRYGAGGGTDAFWAMRETADGNRIFAGLTNRIGPDGINAYVLVAAPDGSIVRENGYGHPGYDRVTDVVPAGDGFLFAGHSQKTAERMSRQTYLLMTDARGLPLWERVYGGPEMWSALYLQPAGDGGFVIAGGTDASGDGDMFVLKVDAEGRELWRKRVGTPDWDEINHGILVRPDGTIVLIGYTNPHGSDQHDLVAATLSKNGDLVRIERFGGPKDERARLAKLDDQGMIWMTGLTESAGAGGADLLLVLLDVNGAFTGLAMTMGGADEDVGTAALPVGKDSILLAGYSRSLGQGGEDAFIARIARPAGKAHPAFTRTVVVAPK
jgi:hypothetical protein